MADIMQAVQSLAMVCAHTVAGDLKTKLFTDCLLCLLSLIIKINLCKQADIPETNY